MFRTKKMEATKIQIRRTQRYGASRRHVLVIPDVFVRDNNLQIDDEYEIYRTKFNGSDALIVVPLKVNGDANNIVNPKSEDVTEL